ncbi:DUF7574 domain-containing protein [Nonomuraea jabiensis]|uniref:DUF7574 domain-containing protein n=1 Tax=Nonomuraea jabiensis TaxID=882448 RepID=UPI003D705FBC
MSWSRDVYHNPEYFGLEIVGCIDFSDGCYQFDYTVVWRNAEGQLLFADDSGCSCPSPFESHKLEDLKPATLHTLQAHLEARLKENGDYYSRESENERIQGEIVALLSRIRMESLKEAA